MAHICVTLFTHKERQKQRGVSPPAGSFSLSLCVIYVRRNRVGRHKGNDENDSAREYQAVQYRNRLIRALPLSSTFVRLKKSVRLPGDLKNAPQFRISTAQR